MGGTVGWVEVGRGFGVLVEMGREDGGASTSSLLTFWHGR